MAHKDYYVILNIDPSSGLKAIKSAYRKMALKYHPDHNPNSKQSLIRFNLVREAYETLTDPELRKKYDKTYKPSVKSVTVQPDTGSSKKAAKNLRYNLYITLEDVVKGCERSIRYIRKNRGTKETVQVKIKVPKGVFHHQRLKLAHYGDRDDKTTGDLFIIIHLQDHPIFLKRGLDLKINVPISYLDVILGENLVIPTLFGLQKLKLKACDFDNLTFTWKGFGLPNSRKSSKGDLKVHCFIEHPGTLNIKDKNNLQKIQKNWPKGEMTKEYQSYLNQFKESGEKRR